MQEQIEALKLKQQQEINNMLSKLASAKAQIHGSQSVKVTADNNSNECEGPKVEVAATSAPLWQRKFKIVGQIGKPGQIGKLTFVSLTHQIDSGLKRQYKENEIVDVVIRAISLHSSLRSYMETLHDLSLPKLCKILCVHYRERSASELYQQLATIFEQPK
jgi:hypothetical protein